jgi:hypothetical protein
LKKKIKDYKLEEREERKEMKKGMEKGLEKGRNYYVIIYEMLVSVDRLYDSSHVKLF